MKLKILGNGGAISDPAKVHLSESDLIERALPHSGCGTIFYGTHLKKQKKSVHEKIRYVQVGDILDI